MSWKNRDFFFLAEDDSEVAVGGVGSEVLAGSEETVPAEGETGFVAVPDGKGEGIECVSSG